MIEPSGLSFGHHATAVGKGKMLAKTEVRRTLYCLGRVTIADLCSFLLLQLEKLDFDSLSDRDAVFAAARMYVAPLHSLPYFSLT